MFKKKLDSLVTTEQELNENTEELKRYIENRLKQICTDNNLIYNTHTDDFTDRERDHSDRIEDRTSKLNPINNNDKSEDNEESGSIADNISK